MPDGAKRLISNITQPDSILKEAELTLQALGYNQSEAKEAVRKAVSAHLRIYCRRIPLRW